MKKHTLILYTSIFFLLTGFTFKESFHKDLSEFPNDDTIRKASEPYPNISAKLCGPEIRISPDPLVNYCWQNPKASDGLEIYNLKPIAIKTTNPLAFQNILSAKTNKPAIIVNGKGTILLDFGQVNAAWLEMDSPDLTDTIQMSISEYNEPAILNKGAQNRIKTKIPVKYGNTYRLELNRDYYEGVRYGWIHVNQFSKPWHITAVRLVCQIRPTNYKGNFSCSDTLLSKIWYTGAYVVKLNLLKDFFGAILMERSDRHSWTGDAHPAQAASMVAFGNYDFVKKNIEYTSSQNNGIASYSLLWVLSLVDYYNYTGDTATFGKFLENACKKLDSACNHYGRNPKLKFFGWDERLGAGFENSDCLESQNAYKMLTLRSLMEFAGALDFYGRKKLAKKYRTFAETKIAELRGDTKWYNDFGVHSAAEALNAGIPDKEEAGILFRKEFSDRLHRLSYSPFNQYFIIQAMARMKKYDEALTSVRDCWGGQLKYGGTTFFEVYRPSWNKVLGFNDAPPNNQCGYTSLAHPWGAGVTKWLSEEILGIKPTKPGFKTFDVLPHLGRTLTTVSGKVPTPLGAITADFNVITGKCHVSVPKGSTARIGIPKVEKNVESIALDGKIIWESKYIQKKGICQDAEFVYLSDVQPGNYNISVTYKGTTPQYSAPDFVFPAQFIKEDSLTKGSWGGKYGTKGYVLCNYNGEKNDSVQIPSYVTSVTFGHDPKTGGAGIHANKLWASGENDPRALSASPANNFPRNIGCIYTQDPLPTMQSMTVDIKIDGTRSSQFAFYFVDWDHKNRRTAIEVFDLETKKLISPLKIISNYDNGKYFVFKYNKSIRLRINQVRGENAVMSGIFFD